MSIVSSLLVVVSVIFLIFAGLLGLIDDLLKPGSHEAPLIDEDGLHQPPRGQESATRPDVSAARSHPTPVTRVGAE